MSIIQIAPVTRNGIKLLISLFGLSETGKTYSALKLAAGIEPDPMKRGLLDTEGGQRGRAYADVIDGGFMYGYLTAPFTPERYMQALADFVAAGVTTLVVDSISHAWFAEGGILDMVEAATETGQGKWAKPKRRLGKLTGQWLGCGLHLILCARGKQPLIEGVVNGKKTLTPGPIVPVQEKTLRFDLTVMALMLGDGEFTIDKQYGGKCPGSLRPIFASGTKMDEDMGRRLIQWAGGQDSISAEQRSFMMSAEETAASGTDEFRIFWKKLEPNVRDFLKPSLPNYQSIAAAADAEKVRFMGNAEDSGLDDPFASGPALVNGVKHTGMEEAA